MGIKLGSVPQVVPQVLLLCPVLPTVLPRGGMGLEASQVMA